MRTQVQRTLQISVNFKSLHSRHNHLVAAVMQTPAHGYVKLTTQAKTLRPVETRPQQRHFAFGVISDIQYANIDDGTSFHGVPRFYRNSLVALRRAVDAWRASGDALDFAVHYGDILDGFHPKDQSESALDEIVAAFDVLGKPHYHMLGNHCLYNLPRHRLNQKLGMHTESGVSYYSFSPHPQWLILVVDAYDVSVLGWPEGHPLHEQAVRTLAEKNPNQNKNSPEGLSGVDRRFVAFNGGASAQQLEWVRQQLQAARASGQRALVFSHLPCMPGTCPNACLLWNYEQLLQVLREAGNVVATMTGHAHTNGYVMDEAGIHHLVLPAVLETPPGRDAYGSVEVWGHALRVKGVDTMMSLELPIWSEALTDKASS